MDRWPAPGSEDTELGVLMELEVGHGETEVYPRVQALGCAADQGARRVLCAGLAGLGRACVAVARLGEEVRRRSGTCVSWPRPDEAGAARDRASQARGHQAEGRARHPKKLSRADARLRAVETAGAILAAWRGAALSLLDAHSPFKNMVHRCMRT